MSGMVAHLAIAPAAAVVLIIGSCFLRTDRRRGGLANPAWLWVACLGSLVVIFATYVFGTMGIHTWLQTSVSRTTIFAQLLLYAEIALWLVLAVDAATGPAGPAAARRRPHSRLFRARGFGLRPAPVLTSAAEELIGAAMSSGPDRRSTGST